MTREVRTLGRQTMRASAWRWLRNATALFVFLYVVSFVPVVGFVVGIVPMGIALMIMLASRAVGLDVAALDGDEIPGPLAIFIGYAVVAGALATIGAWRARRSGAT
jgi:hypothetical protein